MLVKFYSQSFEASQVSGMAEFAVCTEASLSPSTSFILGDMKLTFFAIYIDFSVLYVLYVTNRLSRHA
jgi:hypothetical protein